LKLAKQQEALAKSKATALKLAKYKEEEEKTLEEHRAESLKPGIEVFNNETLAAHEATILKLSEKIEKNDA